MSISSISQSNVLGEDVLQIIFQHLDAEDLLKCEAVCRQWRDILLAGTPWRRLYHRNIVRLPQWRDVQKELELDQKTLPTEQYRDIFLLDRNWRRGHFTKLTYPVDSKWIINCYFPSRWSSRISISNDYVSWALSPFRNGQCQPPCVFLDTESKEIIEFPIPTDRWKLNEMLVFWRDRRAGILEIVDPKNRWVVNVWEGIDEEEKKREKHFNFAFGSKLLVTYCNLFNSDSGRMRIWKIGNPPVLLHDRLCKYGNLVKVDERFIVFSNSRTLYFISTETFEELRTVSLKHYKWHYDRGLLFQFFKKWQDKKEMYIIRILDVASGTFFNDLRKRFWNGLHLRYINGYASTNSRFMVIGWKRAHFQHDTRSHLTVYDLEAVKNPSADRRSYILYILRFEFELQTFVMDESRIVFNGFDGNQWNVTVLNFADFERKASDWKDNHGTEMEIYRTPKDERRFSRWPFSCVDATHT